MVALLHLLFHSVSECIIKGIINITHSCQSCPDITLSVHWHCNAV